MTATSHAPVTNGGQFALRPLRRSGLTEGVAQQILAQIKDNNLPPGTKMPSERELMSAMEVGRSTIREALKGLEVQGYVEIRHGQGAFVSDGPPDAAAESMLPAALAKGVTADLIEARRPVELEIARLAPLRRTKADIDDFRDVLSGHRESIRNGELATPFAARFHLVLAQAAHNEVLYAFVSSLIPLFEERGPALEAHPEFRQWEYRQHRNLFEAVRSKDVTLTVARMHEHLDQTSVYHQGSPLLSGQRFLPHV